MSILLPDATRRSAPSRVAGVVLALLLAVGCAGSLASARGITPWRWWACLVLAVVLCAAFALPRATDRRRPGWATVALVVAGAALPVVSANQALLWPAFIAVAVAASTGWDPVAAGALALAPLAGAMAATWRSGAANLAAVAATCVATFAVLMLRTRQREAEELARAREAALTAERARYLAARGQRELAGQVHDVLAHTLSGLVVTLQTARLEAADSSPELRARLDDAVALAREGLAGARDAVARLRGDEAPAPDPAAVLAGLVTRSAAPVRVHGVPADLGPLDPGLVAAVLTEGATNALRHAAGVPLEITFAPGRLTMLSPGDPAAFTDLAHPSGGRGLAGLTERAADRGARLTAGPTPAGWLLTLEDR